MKINRKIIEIDEDLCDGCGQCVPSCAEGALQIIGGKARLIAETYCDGLGACLGECPTGALTIVEREADDFDEDAVEKYLLSKNKEDPHLEATTAFGCPSTQIQPLVSSESCNGANQPSFHGDSDSALSHWPVQIKLVPPTAPFLKGADLLVAADCTPVAYPHFHRDFLRRKTIMIGCPKFDDIQEYIQKFADIFKTNDIKSVTVLVMDVPCCQGLPMIVEKGMEIAGIQIPLEKVVINGRGEIIGKEKLAA